MRALLVILLLILNSGARALDGLARGGEGEVAEVVDGDTLTLKSGEQVRLVGIQAPKLPLGRRGFVKWPLADEAKERLEALALGRTVALWHGGARGDRHGRVLAHAVVEGGGWLQGQLLAAGLARVYTFEDNRAKAEEMLALEAEARKRRLGLWAHPFYRMREAEELARDWRGAVDSFVLVEGRVHRVAEVKGRTYLNFAEDWKSDFTASVERRYLRAFRDGSGLAGHEGERIRVRGWLQSRNGPAIEITHPEQIERLKD